TRRLFWAAVGTSVLAAHPCMAVWSAGGMETMLYTFLVVLSALGVLLVHRTDSAWAWVCLTSGLVLLSFGRTEGVLFSFAFGLYAIFQSNDELSWPRTVVCLLIVGATVAAHLLIRKWYYGLWFPLPVYAKGHEGMGLGMVLVALYSYPIQAVLGVLALALTKAPEVRSVLRFSVIATLLMCLILRNVDPVMQNHQRYLTPLIPLFYLAASIGLAELAATMKEGLTPLVLLGFAPFFLNEPQLLGADRNAEVAESISYSEGLRRSHVTLGHWLRENVPDRSTWVASTDCGVLPYYSKLKWIDLAGLNDAYLARNGGEAGYVFDRRPELIILTPLRVDAPIRQSERLAQNYKLVGVWPGFYNLELFRRLDVPPFAIERQGL
ncbi:MAG TPA: hypothetical protein VFP10_06885, partial [Candidatus Eisenbacteria bacterium]|nr:hypothetical protein [Candidatus Eisenbacteria bacterium]